MSLMYKVCEGNVDVKLPSHFSKQLHSLIISLLQKEPGKRPSAAEILKLPFVEKSVALSPSPTPPKLFGITYLGCASSQLKRTATQPSARHHPCN